MLPYKTFLEGRKYGKNEIQLRLENRSLYLHVQCSFQYTILSLHWHWLNYIKKKKRFGMFKIVCMFKMTCNSTSQVCVIAQVKSLVVGGQAKGNIFFCCYFIFCRR